MPTSTVLLLCGSVRAGSTNAAVLATAAAVASEDVRCVPATGLLDLPHFDPDADAEGVAVAPAVAAWRAQLVDADAVLVCTPEHAGDLPGLLKEALEWTIGAGALGGTPVGWVNCSTGPTGAADTHASLGRVVGWAGAQVVETASARVPVPRGAVGADGTVQEPDARAAIARALRALADAAAAAALDA